MATSILKSNELNFTSNGTDTRMKISAGDNTFHLDGVGTADVAVTGINTLATSGAATLASAVIQGAATVGDTLSVTNATTLAAVTTGAATLASATIQGAATVGDTLSVTNATSLSTVSTSGLATLASATIQGAATVGDTLSVTNATSLSTVSTSGLATLASAAIQGAATVGTDLTVTGAATVGDLTVNGVNILAPNATNINAPQATITCTKVTGLAVPSQAADGANKAYVDAVANGLHWQTAVKRASVPGTSYNLSTDIQAGLAFDGLTLSAGDRILLMDQTTSLEDGVYEVQASGYQRAADFDSSKDVASFAIFVEGGTHADQGFVCTNDTGSATPGSDPLTFTQFTGLGQVTAGLGLTKSGNTIAIDTAVVARVDAANTFVTGFVHTFDDTTQSTATTDGAVVIKGGIGIAKNANIGGNVAITGTSTVTGITSCNSTVNSSTTGNGGLVVAGGVGIAQDVNIGGNVVITGNCQATEFNAVSDENFKQDIVDIGENDLERLMNVRAVSYRFKGVGDESLTRYGVLAQDLEANGLGHMVRTDHKGHKKVCYNDLVGLLIGQVKELKEEVQTLKC
jgi:hypothetical protein